MSRPVTSGPSIDFSPLKKAFVDSFCVLCLSSPYILNRLGMLVNAFRFLAVLIVVVGLTVMTFAIMSVAGGSFFYTIDDPYIHLALAENIVHGHYGINLTEFSSPSSSILYPFILATLLSLGLGEWAPLIVGGSAAIAVALCLASVLARDCVIPGQNWSVVSALILLPFVLLSLNVIGLPFTGMEHSLHVLASVMVIIGFARLQSGQAVPWYLLAGIVLAPLLRFEGIALSGSAILALIFLGRWRAGVFVGAVIVALLGFYMFQMLRVDLPILPSSVMAKSSISASAVDGQVTEAITKVVRTIVDAVETRHGTTLVVLIGLVLVGLSQRPGPNGNRLAIAGVAIASMVAHLLGGTYDWWSRYEIYIFSVGVVACFLLYREALTDVGWRGLSKLIGVISLLLVSGSEYAVTLLRTPMAAQNIQLQQFQMHRFSTEILPVPVAVNDLGYVSWQNDIYVLDLWGLGSETARRRWKEDGGISPAGLVELTDKTGVVYAMVYEEWVGRHVPASWCHVGTLITPKVSVAYPEVQFFLVDQDYQTELDAAITRFSSTLPKGASFKRENC